MSSAPAGDPFNALGDPHRRFIVEMLRAGGHSVREIADALPISRPAVSRHLRLLKDAGLVVEQARGTQRIYRLHDEGVAAVADYLTQVWGEAVRDPEIRAIVAERYATVGSHLVDLAARVLESRRDARRVRELAGAWFSLVVGFIVRRVVVGEADRDAHIDALVRLAAPVSSSGSARMGAARRPSSKPAPARRQ